MNKVLRSLFFVFLIFFSFTHTAFSQSNFETSAIVEYKVEDTGKTIVTYTISIKNQKSASYPKQYILTLNGAHPENIKAYESGYQLDTKVQRDSIKTIISIDFVNATVGKGNNKTFVLSYEDKTIAEKTGEIWEVSIPKIDTISTFDNYKVNLSVPTSFGEEAYISPEPTNRTSLDNRNIYVYDQIDTLKSGVTAGFGVFQVFSFSINYHLENSENIKKEMQIAIPPDTSTQKMLYTDITPRPENINVDPDGNWLASFDVDSNSTLLITTKGYVQIFASPRKFFSKNEVPKESDIAPTNYWQSDDIAIQNIVKDVKTPEQIYNYVTKNLQYDFSRVNQNYNRLGSLAILKQPSKALCSEFTDLFIALARANGIPAREINGFAYSQNPSLEPLSLVEDVLHSWPEYWDFERGLWIPVDPTWGSTTQGVDFFHKFDLRHFAFVVHGTNPVLPYSAGSYKLGKEPQKDIFVSYSTLPEKKINELKISYKSKLLIPFFKRKITVSIYNDGYSALYNQLFIETHQNSHDESIFDVMPPYSNTEKEIYINYGFFGKNSPDDIIVQVAASKSDIPTLKTEAIVGQIILYLTILLWGILFLQFKLNKNIFIFRFLPNLTLKFTENVKKLFKKKG